MNHLVTLGWDTYFEALRLQANLPHWVPARVIREDKIAYLVQTDTSTVYAEIRGKFRHKSEFTEKPTIGDWVLGVQESDNLFIIQSKLERKNKLSRKAVGNKATEQLLAANIDLMFIVVGIDDDLNLNRIDRYLALAEKTQIKTILVLNKMDICPEKEALKQQLVDQNPHQDILMISAKNGDGMGKLAALFQSNKTGILLGSSGVGKSTIINRLLGSYTQETQPVREQGSAGRHTTSYRQLFQLPGGGNLIDTPGMRELALWEDFDHLETVFQDIIELVGHCKFRTCGHTVEQGCAIREAISNGVLEEKRFINYIKMKKEAEFLQDRKTFKERHDYKQHQKKLYPTTRKSVKSKRR